MPEKSKERYSPKVFGFKVHGTATLERWQEEKRKEMLRRLKALGQGGVFGDEDEDVEAEGEADAMEDDDEGEEAVVA